MTETTSRLVGNITVDDARFALKCADIQARRSKALRLKVGAILLSVKTRGIISSGFNGTPSGESNVCESVGGETLDSVIHAEWNALSKISWWARRRSFLVVTHSPCLVCARRIVVSGVRGVVYRDLYRDPSGLLLLRECGVPVFRAWAWGDRR